MKSKKKDYLNILAIICARGGSKGVKNKNIKSFCGKPLIAHSIEMARSIKIINKVIVSTDSKKIALTSKKFKAEVPFIRPKKLATDNSPEWKTWLHLIKFLKQSKEKMPNIIISIPATSPLRSANDLKNAIKKFIQNKKSDVLITVTEAHRNPYFNMVEVNKSGFLDIVISKKNVVSNRQEAPKVFDVCTLAYVTTPEYILKSSHMFKGNIDYYEVDKSRSIDIDDEYDFNLAEILYKKQNDK